MNIKSRAEILEKLGIKDLNEMQVAAHEAIPKYRNVVLLSPTGTGKTLAFLLPIIESLDAELEEVQAMILVPSRELAIQIEQVAREMGSGFKINSAYGGRNFSKDVVNLAHPPAILIGTPGRIADHMRRESINTDYIKTLVLDEFDKSLEVGFEDDMTDIVNAISSVDRRILTSATDMEIIPEFVNFSEPKRLDFLGNKIDKLQLRTVISPTKDKLETLVHLLRHLGDKSGIVFCNFKDSISEVTNYLTKEKIPFAEFYGGLEQLDRENALIRFRNGTHRLLIATDLAARGIDVEELDYIIHYELPPRIEEFTHRNGRTARMHRDGVAYLLRWQGRDMPPYIENAPELEDLSNNYVPDNAWDTLFISGGRKDKISKGDIVGLFIKEGGLANDKLGLIELKNDCAFVAVGAKEAKSIVKKLDNSRLKTKKVRIRILD